MRLSDIQGERVFDVIADIIDPIANIAEDDAASAMFRREKLPEGMTSKEFVTQRARKALPALLKAVDGAESSHRNPLGLPYASLEYSAPPAGLLWAFGVELGAIDASPEHLGVLWCGCKQGKPARRGGRKGNSTQ